MATAWLFASQAAAQTFVRPGETVTVPTIIKNADDNGEPGGDTISSMKVVVTGDSAFVTSPTDSETLSIAPGEAKTFSPKFVVGSGPGVVDGQTYTVTLKQVSPDPGIDPDPDDPASFITVSFTVDLTPPRIRVIADDLSDVGPENNKIDTGQVSIGGIDVRSDGSTLGSGIASIALDQLTAYAPGQPLFHKNYPLPFPTSESKNFPEGDGTLPRGDYVATVTDRAGNKSSISFTINSKMATSIVDSRGPAFQQSDPINQPTNGTDVQITVEDLIPGTTLYARGVTSLSVSQNGSQLGFNDQFFPAEHVYTSADAGLSILSQLPPGPVDVTATDKAGNMVTVHILVAPGVFVVSDADENVVRSGGYAKTSTIYVSVPPNGLTVQLDGPSSFNPLTLPSTDFDAEFDALGEGPYVAYSYDSNNVLVASQPFIVDYNPPSAQITFTPGRDLDGNQPPDGVVPLAGVFPYSPIALSTPPALDISALAVSAQDFASGLAWASIKEDGAVIYSKSFDPPTQDPQSIPKQTLKNGSLYELAVQDAAGNLTIGRFYAAFKPPALKNVQVTPIRQPDDSALHTVQFTGTDEVWLRDVRLIEQSALNALIPSFGSDSWGNRWDQIVAASLPRSGPPQSIAWLAPGTTSQQYIYQNVPNGDYVAFAVSASSIIGPQAAFSFKDVTHDVVIYDGRRLDADCVHPELQVERPSGANETNPFAGTIHLRQAAAGAHFLGSGLLTTSVGGRSNAGATVSTKLNRISIGLAPSNTSQDPSGNVLVYGLGAEQVFDMVQPSTALPDGSAVSLEADAALPQNVLFADSGQPVDDIWRPVKDGDFLAGARARLRATFRASSDAMNAPFLTQMTANVTDHEVIVTQSGTPDPAMGHYPIPAGTNVTVSGRSPRGNTATVTVPLVSSPGELALVDVPLNADSQCPVTSGLPTPDLLLDVGVLSNGSQTFDIELAVGAAACQPGSGAALIHEGTAGSENITGAVTTSCGIKGTALSASPFYVNVPSGPDRVAPVTSWDSAAPRDAQGDVVISSRAVLPLVAQDDGSGVQVTEAYVDSGPFAIAGGRVSLEEGFHNAFYRSRDAAANVEITHHSRILVDATPPAVSSITPSGGSFAAGVDSPTVSWTLTDTLDQAPTAQAYLVRVDSVASPVPVALGQVLPLSQLDPGTWELVVNGQDWVVNSTTAHGAPFTVSHGDNRPPRTHLALAPPFVSSDPVTGAPAYVSSSTLIAFMAEDDLTEVGDRRGAGVDHTFHARDSSSTFADFSSSFSIADEGLHRLYFYSVDKAPVPNRESVQVATVAVDATPPVTQQSFTGPTVAIDSATIVGPSTRLVLVSTDPVSNGVASGVGPPTWLLDGASSLYSAPFSVPAGSHTVGYFGADRVANAETLHSTTVVGDYDPPAGTVTAGGLLLATKTPALAGSLTDALAGLATATLSLSIDGNRVPASVSFAASGSFSPFQATGSPLTVPVRSHAMAALGNAFYVIGGHDNFTPPYNLGQVQRTYYAALTGGVLGPWHDGPALPQPLSSQAAAAANGYVYAMGGGSSNGASQNVYYAKVVDPQTGQLDASWTPAANNLPVAVSDGDGAVVLTQGSYLYFVNPAGPTAYYSNVANIAPDTWHTTNAPGQQAANGARLVQWGSQLFFIGGVVNGAATASVWTTSSQGGPLAVWTPAPSLPAPRAWGAAAVANGKLLYVSGVDQNNQPTTTAYVYDIAKGGQWTTLDFPYPLVTVSNAAAGSNGVIVVTGGNNFTNGAAYGNSYQTALAPSGPVMTATLSGVASSLGDGTHILTAAGQDNVANGGSVQTSFTVDTTPPEMAMTAQGVALSSLTVVPLATLSPLFVVAYRDDTSQVNLGSLSLLLDDMDVTTRAVVAAGQATLQTADLTAGPHTLQASVKDNAGNTGLAVGRVFLDVTPPAVVLTAPAAGQFIATSTVRLAALMGDVGIGLDTGTVRLAVDGAVLPVTLSQVQAAPAVWTAGPDLKIPVRSQAMTALGNTFYVIGGHDNFTPPYNLGQVSQSYYATMDASGNLGDWKVGPQMDQPYSSLAAAAARGTIYVMGGGGASGPTAQFLYAHVSAAGVPAASWTTGQALPTPVSDGQGAVVLTFGSYLYFINPAAPAIWANQIGDNGDPSTQWVSVPAPAPLAFARVAEWNGRLYLIGGTSGGVAQRQVWASKTDNGTGPITGWAQVTSLPAARSGGAAASLDGKLYYVGGVDANNQPVKTVYVADASGGGDTLNWSTLPDYPVATGPAAAATDGAVVVTGGNNYQNGTAYANAYVLRPPTASFASLSAAATAFALAEGPHVASATVRDLAGNPGVSTAAFNVDASAPLTSLLVAPSSAVFVGTAYVLATSSLTLSATDYPLVGGSGVAATSLVVDGTSVPAPAGFFSLGQGFHAARFYSVDNVGNVEKTEAVSLKMDGVPPAPVTSLALTALSSAAVQVSWTSPGDDGALGDIADAEARVAFGTDPAAFSLAAATTVFSGGALPAGAAMGRVVGGLAGGTTYYAAVFTRDTAGNWSAESATVAVRTPAVDVLPPRTALAALGPSALEGSRLFVTTTTALVLTSTDDLSAVYDARGVGVAAMYYSVDSATFTMVPSTYAAFSLTQESVHTLRYYGVDLVPNVEQVRVASVAVDATPPDTSLLVLASSRTYHSTTTVFTAGLGPLALSPVDHPAVNVGVATSYLALDGAPPAPSSGTFMLPAGLHALSFASVDALGNFGSTVTAQVKAYANPPLAVGDLAGSAVSSTTARFTWHSTGDDGGQGDVYDAQVVFDLETAPSFSTTSAGARLVQASGPLPLGTTMAYDVGGLSAGTTYYAAVFARNSAGMWSPASNTAPVVTFFVATSANGLVTLDSPVSTATVTLVASTGAFTAALSSQALLPAGGTIYQLTDGLTFSSAAPAVITFEFNPFGLDIPSLAIYTYSASSPTLGWSSFSVFNQTITFISQYDAFITGEILHTSLYAPMVRDTVPPVTAFSLAGASAVLEGRLFASEASSGVLTAQDHAPRGGVASGVAQTTYALDGATVTAYAAPFALPGGHHVLSFRSVDKADNPEGPKGAEVFVDTVAPAFLVSADQPTFPLTNGKAGFGVVTTTVTVTLTAVDPLVAGAQSGLASFIYGVDGATSAASVAPGAPTAAASAFLGSGGHTLNLMAADRMGHLSQQSLYVAVGDTVPPVTGIAFLGPQARLPDGSVLVAARTGLALSATDYAQTGVPPAGVASTSYRLTPAGQTPGAFSVYASSVAVPAPDGGSQVDFYSTDKAGNIETAKSTSVVLDSTPPSLAFSFPRADEGGLCRLVQETLSVRGPVQDLHLSSWSLAANGVLVGSGSANSLGTLGLFNAARLSGPISLTLSAQDLVFNASSASLQLQAGQPARNLALGGHGTFNKPRGVATAPNRVYVSDTNDDQVRVFDGAGNALVAFGGKGAPVTFNKPAGLIVDPSGSIFVADVNGKRVVKLSAAGAQLAVFGQGNLQKPTAVALSAGNLVVADAQAGQLVVFAAGGALLSRVSLPPASASTDDPTEPRPMALAADSAGNVWVADQAGARVLRYDPGFNLAQTVAGFQKPDGVAVSPSGACLAVADAGTARLTTFDAALAAQMAAFGVQGDINPAKPLPSDFDLSQPAQLAFAADGSLLVADRNNDLVQGFGLPGAPAVVAMGSAPGGSSSSAKLSAVGGAVAALAVTQRVGAVEGGSVAHPDGTAVQIPPAAIPEDQDVSVSPAATAGSDAESRQAAMAGASLASASSAHQFGPEGLQFAQPATITLPYDPSLVGGMNPSQLKVAYWNPSRGAWETLASNADAAGHTVSAQVLHFSLYQVLAPAQAFTAMADPEATFLLRTIYVFPNPAVGGAKPTISVAVGVADQVKINIYDVAGRAVNSVTLDGAPKTVSDELGTHFAYEYTWDGHIPSGVYIYAVTAEKAGNAPIRRIGKFAVVR